MVEEILKQADDARRGFRTAAAVQFGRWGEW
jgi:hypothetical protein